MVCFQMSSRTWLVDLLLGSSRTTLIPSFQQTEDLEQKKLVYLYLMNYAKTQPELVILAVNTFVKVSSALESSCRSDDVQDTADPNPLVRALAIRTMSVLRTEKTLDYLATPLSRCLKDENPYVRKTAALCVAKVFDLKPELCVEYGFIETLRDLIGDGNPMVCLLCDSCRGRY